jgi:adenosine deaminase
LSEDKISKDCHSEVEREEVWDYMDKYVRQTYFGTTQILSDEQEERVKKLSSEMMKNKENMNNAYDNVFFGKFTSGLKEKLNPKTKKLSYKSFIEEISGKKEKSSSPAKKEGKTKEIETETEIS